MIQFIFLLFSAICVEAVTMNGRPIVGGGAVGPTGFAAITSGTISGTTETGNVETGVLPALTNFIGTNVTIPFAVPVTVWDMTNAMAGRFSISGIPTSPLSAPYCDIIVIAPIGATITNVATTFTPDGPWGSTISATTYLHFSWLGTALHMSQDPTLGECSPSQITGNVNDYNPTGLNIADDLRVSTDADGRQITGMIGQPGMNVRVHNIGTHTLVLVNGSSSSATTNRFEIGADITLAADQSIDVGYDPVSMRWRVAGNWVAATAFSTSAGLAAILSDETGTGSAVFGTSPTIVTPTIASFANATHTHQNAAGGGALDAAAIATGVIPIARLATGTPDGTKFVRDDGTLVVPSGSGGAPTASFFDPVSTAFQWGECGNGTTFDDGFMHAAAGGSGTLLGGTGTVNHPGVWSFDTAASTTGSGNYNTAITAILFGGGACEVGFLFKTPANLSDGTDTYTILAGFGDAPSALPVDGAYLIYDQTQDTHWQYVTSSNSSRTRAATTTTFAVSTWYFLQVKVNAAGTSVGYYINGTLVNTATLTIPTGAGHETGIRFYIVKSAGTSSRAVLMDAYYYYHTFTSARY